MSLHWGSFDKSLPIYVVKINRGVCAINRERAQIAPRYEMLILVGGHSTMLSDPARSALPSRDSDLRLLPLVPHEHAQHIVLAATLHREHHVDMVAPSPGGERKRRCFVVHAFEMPEPKRQPRALVKVPSADVFALRLKTARQVFPARPPAGALGLLGGAPGGEDVPLS